jgi:hypothetical protein
MLYLKPLIKIADNNYITKAVTDNVVNNAINAFVTNALISLLSIAAIYIDS